MRTRILFSAAVTLFALGLAGTRLDAQAMAAICNGGVSKFLKP